MTPEHPIQLSFAAIKNSWLFFLGRREYQHQQVLFVLWSLFLYLIGMYFWGSFMDWHWATLNFHDWHDITIPRLDFTREALLLGQLPLHSTNIEFLHNITNRFFCLPDVITTPQILLLNFISVQSFVFVDLLFNYTLGLIGLALFARKYKISPAAYTFLFFLFNFNGHIVAHYSVGHDTWGGYFLFPLMVLLITDFVEGVQGWRWATKMALTMFYMVLAGSEHHFLWWMIFLMLMAVVYYRRAHWIILAMFGSGMISAVRLLPPLLTVQGFMESGLVIFRGGYPTVLELVKSLVISSGFDYQPVVPGISITFYSWELNLYIGLVGCLIIAYGFGQWFLRAFHKGPFTRLLFPFAGIVVLSIGDTYHQIGLSAIPLFASERVLSRMVIVPFTMLLFLAIIFLDQRLHAPKFTFSGLFVALGLPIMVNDLWQHTQRWSILEASRFFRPIPWRFPDNMVAQINDPPYTAILLTGLALTIIFLSGFLWLSYREAQNTKI